MSKVQLFVSLSSLLVIGAVLVGCSGQQSGGQKSASPKAPQAQPAAANPTAQAEQSANSKDSSKDSDYKEALAELSPEDRALAEKQKVCPVSGEPLGSMGKPYKVTVKGRDVLLCCPHCEAKIKADPDKYLAKLPK